MDFDIDTSELEEQSNQIRQQMQQIATQYQQMIEQAPRTPRLKPPTGYVSVISHNIHTT